MKVEKYPFKGSEIVPEIMSLQAVEGLCPDIVGEWLTACLLNNEPASYLYVARLTPSKGGSRSESESE